MIKRFIHIQLIRSHTYFHDTLSAIPLLFVTVFILLIPSIAQIIHPHTINSQSHIFSRRPFLQFLCFALPSSSFVSAQGPSFVWRAPSHRRRQCYANVRRACVCKGEETEVCEAFSLSLFLLSLFVCFAFIYSPDFGSVCLCGSAFLF